MGGTYSKKKIIKILIVIIVLTLAVTLTLTIFKKNNQKKAAMAVMTQNVAVSTVKIEKMDLSNSISVTGSIESVDSRTITTDLKDVTVTEVLVKVGEYVEAGQVICKFDASELEDELAKTQNNYSVNQQLDDMKKNADEEYGEAIEKAQKSYASTETSYHTKAAEYNTALNAAYVAFGIDSTVTDATDLLQAAIETLGKDDVDYNTKSEIAKNYESAKSSFVSAETSMIKAKETYDEEVEKAKETYEQNKLSEQLISEDSELSKIEDYTEQIKACTIIAPTSGVIASLNVSVGDTISGGEVFSMLDNEHFKVTATVDEYDINSIILNQKAYVKTNATGDAEMPATVTYVAVTSESGQMSQSASYKIEITLDEAQTLLRRGMTASVSIELEGAKDVLAVPYDCVTTQKGGKSTITVIENEVEKTVEVTKGLETDYYVEISGDGISEGMEVLLPTSLVNVGNNKDMEFGFTIPGGDMGSMPGGNMGGGPTSMPSGGNSFGGSGGGNFGGSNSSGGKNNGGPGGR